MHWGYAGYWGLFSAKTVCVENVFVLAFQIRQNHFHKYQEQNVRGSKVQNLSQHIPEGALGH